MIDLFKRDLQKVAIRCMKLPPNLNDEEWLKLSFRVTQDILDDAYSKNREVVKMLPDYLQSKCIVR